MMDWRLLYRQFQNDLRISSEHAINNLYDNVDDDKLLYLIDMFIQSDVLGDEDNTVRKNVQTICVDSIQTLLEEYSNGDN